MTDTDTTTRLADIRRRIEIARSDGEDKVALGEYIEFLAHAPSDLEWLLAQLDDATIRGDKLYQYGQTADAAYAELARILRETEEQAQAQVDAADLTGQLITLRAERDAWRERAEDAAMAFASQTGYTPPE